MRRILARRLLSFGINDKSILNEIFNIHLNNTLNKVKTMNIKHLGYIYMNLEALEIPFPTLVMDDIQKEGYDLMINGIKELI